PYNAGWAGDIARKRVAIGQAKLCIAISHATADDLLAFYPSLKGRVRVTHLGADHLAAPGPDSSGETYSPFTLFIGDRHGYNNFAVVLDALTRPAWPQGLRLHVVGPLLDE